MFISDSPPDRLGGSRSFLKALPLLLLLPLLWAEGAWAVTCAQTNYYLDTQAEVDALGATGCDSISGSLRIRDSALTNLDGLANITSVGGDLDIKRNEKLTNLDGLANITSVGGDLDIYDNDTLTNLDGLANLVTVGSDLDISRNEKLTNLDGLISLTSVGGDMEIAYSALTNVDGLESLTSVGGDLDIYDNDTLTNLDPLANLTSVGGDLDIFNNDALTNIDGLASLTSVGGGLDIAVNDVLTNLGGLANITGVGGFLSIRFNYALTNLDGLANITSVGSYLLIESNLIATCEGIAPLLGWPSGPPADAVVGDIDIERNGAGCDSIEQVLASVSGPTKPSISNAETTGAGSIAIEFSSSTTSDALFPIAGYEAACEGSSAAFSEAPDIALLDNTPVTRTFTVSGYDPVSVLSAIAVDIDITHSDPADLYITLTTPKGTELVLWNQAGSVPADIYGTFPTTLTPIDSLSSVAGQDMDGNWVLKVEDVDVGPLQREGALNSWGLRISENPTSASSGSPITVNGLTRGRDYSCTVAPVTGLGKAPVSDAVTAKSDFPSTPNIDSTDYEDGLITLRVSVADNGGADITQYDATCTDGTNTFTGTSTSSPITVSGLTNDVAYTCKVTATNSVGTSSASAATDPITPEELPAGLPIWLLYQATQ